MRFEISAIADGTEIRFTHLGLVPTYECYEACTSAWAFFVRDSLPGLIATGAGQPMTLEQTRPEAVPV